MMIQQVDQSDWNDDGGNNGGNYGNDPGDPGNYGTDPVVGGGGPGTYTQNADFTFQDSANPYYQVQQTQASYADSFGDAVAYGFKTLGNDQIGAAAQDGGAIIVNNDTLVSKGSISVSDGTNSYSIGPTPGSGNAVFVKENGLHFIVSQGSYPGL